MKKSAAWISIVVIVWFASGGSALGGGGSYDIAGLSTNLPQAEAEQIIAKLNWSCKEETYDWAIVKVCKTGKKDIEEVKIHYATKFNKHPIFYIWAVGTHPISEIVERIGRPPDFHSFIQTSDWELDGGVLLSHFDGEGGGDEKFTAQSMVQLDIAPPSVRDPYLEQLREWKSKKKD